MIISDQTLRLVKEVPFTSVLEGEQVGYKRIGKEAVTICPWHNDSNPSLTINDDKGFCYCFACQTGNDGIGFIQQKFGLSFSEAVLRIANTQNIDISYEDIDPEKAAEEAKARASALHQLAQEQELYRSNLRDPRASRARDALYDRHIEPKTSKHFGLGYATSGFFANRITIPIRDHRGSIVGFTGRALWDEKKFKYKNSEASELFDKSQLVYNEWNALEHIKEADSVIFVEGHFDVISLWQYGIKNVVAMQGTGSPSESIIRRLSRRTKRFILCYDADDGGKKATEQFIKIAGPMACRGELTVSVAALPEGTDPDQCIREGSIDFFSVIENAPSWLDWQLDVWLSDIDRSDTVKFTAVENQVRALVESIQSPALRQYYIDKASKNLAADASAAILIARRWAGEIKTTGTKRKWTKPTPSETRVLAEKRLLRLYIHFPELRSDCLPLMKALQSPAYRWLWQRLAEIESHSRDLVGPPVVLAILAVCEPHYTRQLRPLAVPTIKVVNNPGILNHIKETLTQELKVNGI